MLHVERLRMAGPAMCFVPQSPFVHAPHLSEDEAQSRGDEALERRV